MKAADDKKRVAVLVMHGENLELRKDTGQMAYQLYRQNGCDSSLVTYYYRLAGGRRAGPVTPPPANESEIAADYPLLATAVNGLKLKFLPDLGRGKFYERAVILYLRAESRQIDLLVLFHFSVDTIVYTMLYKWLNPAGKVYVKLDIDLDYYRGRRDFFNANIFFPAIKRRLFDRYIVPAFFKQVTLLSAEHAAGKAYFKERFSVPEGKLIQVKNGVDRFSVEEIHPKRRSFTEKENIILTVGRIGALQKDHALLCRAISLLELNGWKVVFAGPVEPGFTLDVEGAELAGRLDPAALYDLYDRARIFCLPSAHEGFPLAACEAAWFGNFLVMTDRIDCFPELTDHGRYGARVSPDPPALAEILQTLIDDPGILESAHMPMQRYAAQELTWQSIIPGLYHTLFNTR